MKRIAMTLSMGLLLSTPALAQASKFVASWDNAVKTVKAEIETGDANATCTGASGGTGTMADPCVRAEVLVATLDVAQQKDLLIGVSAQIGLITLTQAKGKSADFPTLGSATASGTVRVTLELRDPITGDVLQTAAPGTVTFASRLQELKVGVDANLADEEWVDVLVSLLLDTVGSHHFNFIGVDLPQGIYDVVAVFDLSAFVAIAGEDAVAEAEVVLASRMVTAQEVRAAKGTLEPLVP